MTVELNDLLCFGKYKGISLRDIAEYDPQYIVWADENTRTDFNPRVVETCKKAVLAYEDEKEYDMYFGLDGW